MFIKNIKIGKYIFDEETLTRTTIVKLAKLKYKIKDITKILHTNRRLAWKWSNFDKVITKGFRKSKFSQEEKNIYAIKLKGK